MIKRKVKSAKKATNKVTLMFDSKQEKDYFLGQLSDGWGEKWVDLKFIDTDIYRCWNWHEKMT